MGLRKMVRETVIFKENELDEDQWEVISQIEYLTRNGSQVWHPVRTATH
jgi:hypothetical protein